MARRTPPDFSNDKRVCQTGHQAGYNHYWSNNKAKNEPYKCTGCQCLLLVEATRDRYGDLEWTVEQSETPWY